MRSISPIVAVVILLLMTVAAAALAYLTVQSFQQQTEAGGAGGLENMAQSSMRSLKIESVSDGKIYLRNLGTSTFRGAGFYIEGRPLNTTGPDECESGKICVYSVTEIVDCLDECDLSMGKDMPIGAQLIVDEEDINPPVVCGDLSCETGEDCENCPADCGGCVYSLKLENRTDWQFNLQTAGYGVRSADVDLDGAYEILAIGTGVVSGEFAKGHIKIFNRTNDVLVAENTTRWGDYETGAYSIEIINLDADASPEIITAGYRINSSGVGAGQLRIWNYTNGNLLVENSTEWNYMGEDTYAYGVYAANVDVDASIEIITGGKGPGGFAQLAVWNYTNGNLLLEDSDEWNDPWFNQAAVNDVYASDVDGDGTVEIITNGFSYDGSTDHGQVRVWNMSGGLLNLENSTEWYLSFQHTVGNKLHALNVDTDPAIEIVCASETANYANLRIWNFTTGSLLVEDFETWTYGTSTTLESVYSIDIDGDGTVEILTYANDDTGSPPGQLRVWNYTNNNLNLEASEQWSQIMPIGFTQEVYALDFDADGENEIFTVGSTLGGWAELRIWNYTHQ